MFVSATSPLVLCVYNFLFTIIIIIIIIIIIALLWPISLPFGLYIQY